VHKVERKISQYFGFLVGKDRDWDASRGGGLIKKAGAQAGLGEFEMLN
jgi:hypothetical protein